MGREEGDPTGRRGCLPLPGSSSEAPPFSDAPRLGLCLSAGTFMRTWVQDGGSEACVCPQVWAGCMVVTGAGLWLEAPGELPLPGPPWGPASVFSSLLDVGVSSAGSPEGSAPGACGPGWVACVGPPAGRLRGRWELVGEQRPARPGLPSDFGPWRLAWPKTREPGGDRMADGVGHFCDGSVGRARVLWGQEEMWELGGPRPLRPWGWELAPRRIRSGAVCVHPAVPRLLPSTLVLGAAACPVCWCGRSTSPRCSSHWRGTGLGSRASLESRGPGSGRKGLGRRRVGGLRQGGRVPTQGPGGRGARGARGASGGAWAWFPSRGVPSPSFPDFTRPGGQQP